MSRSKSIPTLLTKPSPSTGRTLAYAKFNRRVVSFGPMGTDAEQQEALHELGVFARIYHRVASKSWPARIFRLPGFTGRDDTTSH